MNRTSVGWPVRVSPLPPIRASHAHAVWVLLLLDGDRHGRGRDALPSHGTIARLGFHIVPGRGGGCSTNRESRWIGNPLGVAAEQGQPDPTERVRLKGVLAVNRHLWVVYVLKDALKELNS